MMQYGPLWLARQRNDASRRNPQDHTHNAAASGGIPPSADVSRPIHASPNGQAVRTIKAYPAGGPDLPPASSEDLPDNKQEECGIQCNHAAATPEETREPWEMPPAGFNTYRSLLNEHQQFVKAARASASNDMPLEETSQPLK